MFATRTMSEKTTDSRSWHLAGQPAETVAPCVAPPEPDLPRPAGKTRRPDHPPKNRSRRRGPPRRRSERKLPLKWRVALGVVGGLLLVLGVAGLFLPFLQGVLFLALGGAILSLTSDRFYDWLYRRIGDRWPGAWDRLERFRTRVRWKLRR